MRAGLDRLLCPAAVAVVGASDDRAKFGGRILHYLLQHGFSGRVLPVSPRRESLLGLPSYPSVDALPDAVDVAVLAVPNPAIVETLEACARRAIAGAVIISTGFAEAGEEGRARQAEIVRIARRTGLRIWGPNCLGFVNPASGVVCSSTYVLDVPELPRGGTALISQSGALMSALFDRALTLGIGLRFLGSTGNEVDVDASELIEFFADDSETRAIALYMEGVKRPDAFRRALARAGRAGKPVVVLKVGRTAEGARAAMSHTASMAGTDAVFDAVCASHGAIRVDDPDLLLLVPDLIARLPRPVTDGIALVSPSGGACSYVVDQFEPRKLRLAEVSAEGQARLAEMLGAVSSRNPIDLGTPRNASYVESAQRTVDVLDGEPDVGAVLLALTTIPGFGHVVRGLMERVRAGAKPWIVYSPLGTSAEPTFAELRAHGIPLFLTLPHALDAVQAWLGYHRWRAVDGRNGLAGTAAAPSGADAASVSATRAPAVDLSRFRGRRVLTEREAKSLLALAGIPATREQLAQTVDEAVAHARAIGLPVVLKVISPAVPHRARAGGLALSVFSEADVRRYYAEIVGNVRRQVPEAAIDGVLIQERVSGGVELLLGGLVDPQFGAFVMLGTGGPHAELLADRVLRPAPADAAVAREMLDALRSRDMVLRASPSRDVDALVRAIVGFSGLLVSLGPAIQSFDVNPLWVFQAGNGVAAGDALAILHDA
jgi:acetyl-CoA synthetase (ADP-forming)